MYTDATLPFPRGSTYKDHGELTLSSNTTCGAGVVGRLFETTDKFGRPLVLRAVRADAALTDIGFQCVSYTAGKIGTNVDALCNADGEVASIVDDAYPDHFDVAAYDIFYVVEEGHVIALAETDVAVGSGVAGYASTNAVKLLTADKYCIGTADCDDGDTTYAVDGVSAGVTSGYASINVTGNLKVPDKSV
jgi:hypothetical protein